MARSARRKNYRKLDGLVFGLEIFVDYQETRTPRKLEHFGELFCKPGKLERSSFPGEDCSLGFEIIELVQVILSYQHRVNCF